MRALRVVGITEGGGEISVVLEDPERHERFSVVADEQLRAAARGDLSRLGQIAIELESQLRPREIQARIRAGASVEQVAAAAGVPLQKIERFAYPVLLERTRTAEVAQRAHPVRADGPDTRMLGDVVAHTFGLRGQEYGEAEWDSWKGEDGRWVVALSWRAGRSDNRAHWTFQPGANGGTVTAIDEHASDLVEGLPARPLRTVGPVIEIGRTEEPAAAPTPDRPEELRAAASDNVRGGRIDAGREHSPSPEPPRVAERSARTAPEPRRSGPPAQRQAPPEPRTSPPAAPEREQQPAAPAAKETPAAPAASEQASERPAAEATADEQQPAPEQQPAANRRTKKGKPVMPSWDEVLLGVRGQR
ncbi:septation protein SepH [Pseudonocardia xinjiangensis]|uniref:DUF3071 domain-containing protein n=1 Tax=Pseudonocardia xinjiangensis TaxID=75289 RepID=A0ABX1RN94_9PSEU|nr:septation protein SepH [Pseudonocardia xinjiangensis]NMH81867.1 DUF3071 domain-containing protein [Pseudonocardia xinjiangensis]